MTSLSINWRWVAAKLEVGSKSKESSSNYAVLGLVSNQDHMEEMNLLPFDLWLNGFELVRNVDGCLSLSQMCREGVVKITNPTEFHLSPLRKTHISCSAKCLSHLCSQLAMFRWDFIGVFGQVLETRTTRSLDSGCKKFSLVLYPRRASIHPISRCKTLTMFG